MVVVVFLHTDRLTATIRSAIGVMCILKVIGQELCAIFLDVKVALFSLMIGLTAKCVLIGPLLHLLGA